MSLLAVLKARVLRQFNNPTTNNIRSLYGRRQNGNEKQIRAPVRM
ncbi:Uncharacterised protein [Mycobacteroides abscessus subsp. abscessus]|nr:Uncharacterised protein [Mycobacteroides abscessus subsp. abscessus]SHR94522.1 Uncharacterised protein [Mycobacteroides abscessus subsp. abscessus]SHY12567.1 Uncharacterised protein [Mycobacteroides abscessus subsp. abscessus]SIC20477.1 Uncharacterised protein [Mycobacteroides abscessus subsp. abscessus]SLL30571.1 Uncharacterised protein [Mycobacteroides abscessus subsp. abscessus]